MLRQSLEIVRDFKCSLIVKEHLTVLIRLDLNLGSRLCDRQTNENKGQDSKLIWVTIYGTDCDDMLDPTSQVSDLHYILLLPHLLPLMTMVLHYHLS